MNHETQVSNFLHQPGALRLSKEINMYAYDAYFLDCAIRYKAPILTLDSKLKAAAQSIKIDALEV